VILSPLALRSDSNIPPRRNLESPFPLTDDSNRNGLDPTRTQPSPDFSQRRDSPDNDQPVQDPASPAGLRIWIVVACPGAEWHPDRLFGDLIEEDPVNLLIPFPISSAMCRRSLPPHGPGPARGKCFSPPLLAFFNSRIDLRFSGDGDILGLKIFFKIHPSSPSGRSLI